jgi:hypothetical protein
MTNTVKFHSPYNYTFPITIETEKNVDVYIDSFNMSPVPDGAIRIIQLQEPRILDSLYEQIENNKECYTYVLTYREDILATNPKAKPFLRISSWVSGYVPKRKKFSVSTVVGGKNDPVMKGYALRHNLWRNKNMITIPKDFYLSGTSHTSHIFIPWREADYKRNLVLGPTKEPMFDCMFHIAIENTSIKNMFSEKILDCFQTRTVPIYYGCLNISDYFNIEGIIVVNNLTEIINACNRLTPETYRNMLPAMEDNYIRSNNWRDDMGLLKDAVIKLLNSQ